MSICTTMSKLELQEFLYNHGTKVKPMVHGLDEDGVDEYCAEGEKDADVLVSMDLFAGGHRFAVIVREGGKWRYAYEGIDFRAALRAYRENAVETTLEL